MVSGIHSCRQADDRVHQVAEGHRLPGRESRDCLHCVEMGDEVRRVCVSQELVCLVDQQFRRSGLFCRHL